MEDTGTSPRDLRLGRERPLTSVSASVAGGKKAEQSWVFAVQCDKNVHRDVVFGGGKKLKRQQRALVKYIARSVVVCKDW